MNPSVLLPAMRELYRSNLDTWSRYHTPYTLYSGSRQRASKFTALKGISYAAVVLSIKKGTTQEIYLHKLPSFLFSFSPRGLFRERKKDGEKEGANTY